MFMTYFVLPSVSGTKNLIPKTFVSCSLVSYRLMPELNIHRDSNDTTHLVNSAVVY